PAGLPRPVHSVGSSVIGPVAPSPALVPAISRVAPSARGSPAWLGSMAASCVALKRTLRSGAAIGYFSTRGSPVMGWAMVRGVLGGRPPRLPFSLKILLENLLRGEDGRRATREHVEALLAWEPTQPSEREIPFMPARVLLQDFTGVPAVVDLAAMRDAMRAMGGEPARINPLQPADLVIDHSVQVDVFGTPDALRRNTEIEFERNRERYAFLRWGQQAFGN